MRSDDRTGGASSLPVHAGISLALAATIIGSWIAAHVYSVFVFELSAQTWPQAAALLALNTWLSVGIFIVAHDCMHGSLVPGRPVINRLIGQLCLTLYAGLSFDHVNSNHHKHHRDVGTAADPDFHDLPPYGFWAWFGHFMREYLSPWQLLHFPVVLQVYMLILGAPLANALVLWCLPAILAAVQLFWFGTYLPHKPSPERFSDQHRSRSSDYSWLVSLLTCFHFGYHHEHHLFPKLPWWRLPRARALQRSRTTR